MFPFFAHWKHQKTFGFLVFSGFQGSINENIEHKWVNDQKIPWNLTTSKHHDISGNITFITVKINSNTTYDMNQSI